MGHLPPDPRECVTCRKQVYVDMPDPCLGMLPGVEFACCGHGEGPGYVYFTNGMRIGFDGPITVGRNRYGIPIRGDIEIRNFPMWWERDYDLDGAVVL